MRFFRRKEIPEGQSVTDYRTMIQSSWIGIAPDAEELTAATGADGTTVKADEAIEVSS